MIDNEGDFVCFSFFKKKKSNEKKDIFNFNKLNSLLRNILEEIINSKDSDKKHIVFIYFPFKKVTFVYSWDFPVAILALNSPNIADYMLEHDEGHFEKISPFVTNDFEEIRSMVRYLTIKNIKASWIRYDLD